MRLREGPTRLSDHREQEDEVEHAKQRHRGRCWRLGPGSPVRRRGEGGVQILLHAVMVQRLGWGNPEGPEDTPKVCLAQPGQSGRVSWRKDTRS